MEAPRHLGERINTALSRRALQVIDTQTQVVPVVYVETPIGLILDQVPDIHVVIGSTRLVDALRPSYHIPGQ